VTARLAAVHVGVLGLAILAMAPGRLGAQGEERSENVLERERYFYRQRAYPFAKIPPHALQSARARYKARWPSAVRAQGVQAVSSTTGWVGLGPGSISNPAYYGTNSSGRVTAIAIDPTNSSTIYVGAADGGVWKTLDGGATWTPLTDSQCSLAIGALAIDPVTPTIVYVGTGEANLYPDGYGGCGVLRSTDGGSTWTHLDAGGVFDPPKTSGPTIPTIVVDAATAGSSTNTTVFAATSVGLYKSTNSGSTWTRALMGGVTDLVPDPSNSATLYAGVSGSGVYKSTDGGTTWHLQLNSGSGGDRIRLAISTSSPSTLYAAVSHVALYKSVDAGATWLPVAASGILFYGLTTLVLAVDPSNPDLVYFGAISLYRSTNGGTDFASIGSGAIPTIHVDQHALAFDPANPSTIFSGNDGGIHKSTDQGQTWVSLNTNLAITQFYPGIAVSPNTAPDILGGTQDNGTVEYTGDPVWPRVLFGDGGFTAIKYQTPTTVFAEPYWTYGPYRRDAGTGGAFLSKSNGINRSDLALFIPPLVMDPVDPQVLYFGTTNLYRTRDNAESWSAIGQFVYEITMIAVAPADTRTIYVGTGAGTVWVTSDGGATWTDVTASLPNRYVTDIAVDAGDPQRAYVTVSGFLAGHVFRTVDRGASWQDISAPIPDVPVNAILRLAGSGELYIGTDLGVFTSTDDGATWAPSATGLPNVAVLDLVFNSPTQTILAATHGRGIFAHTVATPVVLRGDANLDGQVSALDAQGILTGVVGLPLPTGWVLSPNGDANCDGRVAALDAQIVLSFVVGLPTTQFCVGTVR
jgi:photosystem II stability/assembly factor-like uncharacterized protein